MPSSTSPVNKTQAPAIPEPDDQSDQQAQNPDDPLLRTVEKINASDSILVALSDSPTVDEMSAAIALTTLLDRIGKHATAIFSGNIPNAIKFLNPEDTFEKNTDSLQDFIIALNKEKADHIRYMIEGDFVRIYITPYRTTINESDLEFSRGDYNVDLVISFDVQNGEDLDDALSEYGRIMHDATAINISNKAAGRFAELEWTNPDASSVCEMIVDLAEQLGVADFDQDIATALLTGIVAATDRFSNPSTTPTVLALASRLMTAGADQQLITTNITKEGTIAPEKTSKPDAKVPSKDTSNPLDKASDTPEKAPTTSDEPLVAPEEPAKPPIDTAVTSSTPIVTTPSEASEPAPIAIPSADDLIPTPASVTLPDADPIPIPQPIAAAVDKTTPPPSPDATATPLTSPAATTTSPTAPTTPATPPANPAATAAPTLPPEPAPAEEPPAVVGPPDYAKMMEAELAAANSPTVAPAILPTPTPTTPQTPTPSPAPKTPTSSTSPASSAPSTPSTPSVQPTPVTQSFTPNLPPAPPLPMPDANTLPPTPAPLMPEPNPTAPATPSSTPSTNPLISTTPIAPPSSPTPSSNSSFQIPTLPS